MQAPLAQGVEHIAELQLVPDQPLLQEQFPGAMQLPWTHPAEQTAV